MADITSAEDLRARGGLKWSRHGDEVLAAWVAEMDFGLAPSIRDALHEAVDRGDTGYFYPELERQAAEAAVDFWARRFGWKVSPERVFAAPDVVEGMRRAIVHLTDPGSAVILHTPVYFPFFSMVERAGRQMVEVPSRRDPDGRYMLDLDSIARELEAGAGAVVLCNPWNPVGRSFTEPEVTGLLDVASSRGARVIADEIHAALIYEGRHQVAASIAPETVVTVTSASKAWNLPGLKCAQVVLTDDGDAERWSAYHTPDKVGVGTFGLIANAAGYSRGVEWLDDVLGALKSNRDLLGRLLEAHVPEVGYRPPEGTYLAWLDFTRYGLGQPAKTLLDEAAVALTEGGLFRGEAHGHARLNFATPAHILTEMVERMGRALG